MPGIDGVTLSNVFDQDEEPTKGPSYSGQWCKEKRVSPFGRRGKLDYSIPFQRGRSIMFDIFALVVFAWFVFRGFWKGLVRQVVGFLGVIVGYMLAMRFYPSVTATFFSGFSPATGQIIGFLVVFVLCIIVASIISSLIARVVTATGLGGLNRIAGLFVGGAKGCFIVAVVTMMVIAFAGVDGRILQGSWTLRYVRPLSDAVVGFAPEGIRHRYDSGIKGEHPGKNHHRQDPETPAPHKKPTPKKDISV
jgi:membrane protein required for colicin V production